MVRDATATKARIFAAASDEFARYGIAGARIDRIASSARANKAQIYEYFGAKEILFDTVLEHELLRLITELATPDAPQEIAEFVGKAFDYHAQNPRLVKLLYWEALYFGSNPVPGEVGRKAFYRERSVRLQRALNGTGNGWSLDPGHLHFILVTLATSWFGLGQLARLHIEGDPFSEQALAEHRRHLVELTTRMLRP